MTPSRLPPAMTSASKHGRTEKAMQLQAESLHQSPSQGQVASTSGPQSSRCPWLLVWHAEHEQDLKRDREKLQDLFHCANIR